MTKESRQAAADKADRALKLYEELGLKRSEIAERLGMHPHSVAGMIQRARQRRERGEASE